MVSWLAPDFPDDAKLLSTRVLAIFGAALPATTVCMLFAAFLNVSGRFGAPSSLRQLPRALIVVTLVVSSTSLAVKAASAFTAGWYIVALAMLALALPIFHAHAEDDHAKPESQAKVPGAPTAHGLCLVILMIGALASTWIETTFAAAVGPGGITTLELGQRLGAFLANTLAMALTLAVFARWSRPDRPGDPHKDASHFGSTLIVGVCLLAPIQIFLFTNSETLVTILLSHDRFGAEAAEAVASAIRWMTFAPLSAFVCRLFVVRILATSGARTALWVGLGVAIDLAVRALVYRWLTPILGIPGIMIGQSLAPLVPIALYVSLARRRPGFFGRFDLGQARGLPVAAALGCLALVIGAWIGSAAARSLGLGEWLAAFCSLAVSGSLGALAFGVTGLRLKVPLSLG
jgi:peptidoglycan biosynthesis protein MviN/MurJ (putative lipid II flippase)